MTKDNLNPNPSDIHHSDVYDPTHPDADWSGFIAHRSCRKHIESQPDQLTTAIDGTNFGPSDNAPTKDWSKPARRIVGHRESGAATEDIKSCYENEGTKRSSTFSLIGGPIPLDSPSNFNPKYWETEAQAAARKRKTELEQLTNNGRSIHVRGRKRRTIISENEKQPEPKIEDKNTTSIIHNSGRSSNHPTDLIGFRAKFTSCTDPSFLKEIGEAVTASFSNASPSTTSIVPSAPYATDVNLPTDPYRSASGERRKDLLLENFSSVVPGYTGKRTFIN